MIFICVITRENSAKFAFGGPKIAWWSEHASLREALASERELCCAPGVVASPREAHLRCGNCAARGRWHGAYGRWSFAPGDGSFQPNQTGHPAGTHLTPARVPWHAACGCSAEGRAGLALGACPLRKRRRATEPGGWQCSVNTINLPNQHNLPASVGAAARPGPRKQYKPSLTSDRCRFSRI